MEVYRLSIWSIWNKSCAIFFVLIIGLRNHSKLNGSNLVSLFKTLLVAKTIIFCTVGG